MKLIEDELLDVLAKAPSGDDVFVPRALIARVVDELVRLRPLDDEIANLGKEF